MMGFWFWICVGGFQDHKSAGPARSRRPFAVEHCGGFFELEYLVDGTGNALLCAPSPPMRSSDCRFFLSGSLLCFSADGFQTLFFATIYGRDAKKLAEGKVNVVIDQFPAGGLDRRQAYSFVESPSFFEAYKHVLKALQDIRGEQDMPFVRHLVFCEPEVQPPTYIENNPTVDFTCLTPPERNRRQLLVNDVRRAADWPTKERIGLDDSQFEALRQAMTKRLAIIQGPPGTGKTYVGLKIVQVLLQKITGMGPILVVCYTNHALDQFLEGIAAFMPMEDLGKIVRMGGTARIKEEVQRFQLKNYLENRQFQKELSYGMQKAKRARKQLEENIEKMKKLANNRHGWLLTAEQIGRVTNGQSERTLFNVLQQHPDIGKNQSQALHAWLYRTEPLDAPPPTYREFGLANYLCQYSGFDPYICFKAIRATGDRHGQLAFGWLNIVSELTSFGYRPLEAVFAMELNGNDPDVSTVTCSLAWGWRWRFERLSLDGDRHGLPIHSNACFHFQVAAIWLMEYLEYRGRNGEFQEPTEPIIGEAAAAAAAAAAPVGNKDAAAEEAHVEAVDNEVLELDRDFNDVDAVIPDDDDDYDGDVAGFGFRRRNENIFPMEGAPPKLPDFILRCIAKATPLTLRQAEHAMRDPWQLPLPERWRLYR